MNDSELRQLDLQIAEKVFGYDRLTARIDPMNRDGEPQYHMDYPHGHDFALFYSTDISAAFMVIEQVCKRGYEVNILGPNGWHVSFNNTDPINTVGAGGPSLPDCICRAALLVMQNTNKEHHQ